jgi:isoquinoline 1-oxidoreductase beta subunit
MSASRRDFLRMSTLAGAGLVIRVPFASAAAGTEESFAPNQWLRVAPDGKVTLVVARSEMGQGVRTALAMILAEELEADWTTVRIEQASTSPLYEDMNTGGSDSIESSWRPLRRAAAAARTMLIAAAAKSWSVEPDSCRAEKGSVVHGPTGRRLSYGRLASAAAREAVPKEPALKDPRDFRIVGTPVLRVDGPDIVTGKATYGLDARVPGMAFAAVARCPVAGGKARRFDASKASAVPGVLKVAEVSTGVAVVG